MSLLVTGVRFGRRGGYQRQLTHVVESVGLSEPVAEVAVKLQRTSMAGGGRWVIPGQALHDTKLVEGLRFSEPVVEVAVKLQRTGVAGGGRWVIPGQAL